MDIVEKSLLSKLFEPFFPCSSNVRKTRRYSTQSFSNYDWHYVRLPTSQALTIIQPAFIYLHRCFMCFFATISTFQTKAWNHRDSHAASYCNDANSPKASGSTQFLTQEPFAGYVTSARNKKQCKFGIFSRKKDNRVNPILERNYS